MRTLACMAAAAAMTALALVCFEGMGAAPDEPPFIQVPDPTSGENPTYPLVPQPVPEPGKPFQDACFKTALVRVTQEKGLRHEYSRHDPFNKDQSMVILVHPASGEMRVYKTGSPPYDGPGHLLMTLDAEEPRWDSADPDVVWGLREFRIVTVKPRTGETAVVKDFAKDPRIGPILKAEPDLYRVTTKDEGEASRDFRYWCLCIQGSQDDYRVRYVFTWDRQEDRVEGLLKLAKEESEIDWVGMSPLGTWAILGAMPENKGRFAGLTLADRALGRFHRIDFATAHADVGLDSRGGEVVVMQNVRTDAIDLIPLDPKTRPILEPEGGYEGTNRTRLVRLFYNSDSPAGLSSGVHISCNMPGYCVVSTYMEPDQKARNWLDRGIILVKLDPARPQAWHLAKVAGTRGAYWEETQASITSDGSKVVWATNWNQDLGQEKPFLMQLDMPKGWPQRLK